MTEWFTLELLYVLGPVLSSTLAAPRIAAWREKRIIATTKSNEQHNECAVFNHLATYWSANKDSPGVSIHDMVKANEDRMLGRSVAHSDAARTKALERAIAVLRERGDIIGSRIKTATGHCVAYRPNLDSVALYVY